MNMKLSDIKVLKSFAATAPKEEKMNACRSFWNDNHKQIKDIVVDRNNILMDGYVQYLILKENNIKDANVVKVSRKKFYGKHKKKPYVEPRYRKERTTYIFGVHPYSKSLKEYVWRVPESWKGWENDLLPGDRILVHTKYGVKPIVITKIEWLDKCPVDMKVKKVCMK